MLRILPTVIFALVGLLFIVLGRPFIRRAVAPNRLYGLRVRATFADPVVWYDANEATGRDLARLGAIMIVAAFVVPWLAGRHATLVLAAGVTIGVLVLAAVGTARANRMLAARHRTSDTSSQPSSSPAA
jgi:uncharacterized membrane protein